MVLHLDRRLGEIPAEKPLEWNEPVRPIFADISISDNWRCCRQNHEALSHQLCYLFWRVWATSHSYPVATSVCKHSHACAPSYRMGHLSRTQCLTANMEQRETVFNASPAGSWMCYYTGDPFQYSENFLRILEQSVQYWLFYQHGVKAECNVPAKYCFKSSY